MDLKQTCDIMAGFMTGTLVIENGQALLQQVDGTLMKLTERHQVEVRNGEQYELVELRRRRDGRQPKGGLSLPDYMRG